MTMLNQIKIEHFKCFESLRLPLAPLTLLSGLNAAGKSTILQALSLLHQTALESEWNTTLILNGGTVTLGSAGDVIDKISGRNQFSIGLATDHYECTWEMQADTRLELAVPIHRITWREAQNWDPISLRLEGHGQRIYRLLPEEIWSKSNQAKQLSLTLIRLAYVSADRIGPRETYVATTPDQQTSVGPRGEYTPWFLYHFAERQPLEGLLLNDAPPTLLRQVEAWLQRFFPGASITVEPVHGANLMLMGLRTSAATDYHRPQNVGYGITHVLPILAACLGAQATDVLLIENPESHLHPAGQSAIGRFLAMSAASGVQVIMETHSDHVLNGVRRAVKEQIIPADSVSIHYFTPRDEDRGQVTSPLIDGNGILDHWPPGFFDQFDQDTSALIDW
jgi:predicted ATPase